MKISMKFFCIFYDMNLLLFTRKMCIKYMYLSVVYAVARKKNSIYLSKYDILFIPLKQKSYTDLSQLLEAPDYSLCSLLSMFPVILMLDYKMMAVAFSISTLKAKNAPWGPRREGAVSGDASGIFS